MPKLVGPTLPVPSPPFGTRGGFGQGGLGHQFWHKLWLHFFWPTFWLHCILYFTYRGGFAPHIGTVQNTMEPESWPKEMEP